MKLLVQPAISFYATGRCFDELPEAESRKCIHEHIFQRALGLFAINSVFVSLLLEHIRLIAFMVVLKEGETDVLAVWLNVISLQALTGKINSFPSTVPES